MRFVSGERIAEIQEETRQLAYAKFYRTMLEAHRDSGVKLQRLSVERVLEIQLSQVHGSALFGP